MFEKIKEFLDKRDQAKLEEREKQKDNRRREDSVVHKFIPYACYYDKNTLLTKDGQLLKCLRIKGLSYDTSGGDDSLRDSLVSSVFKNVPSNQFSFYLHTIRRRSNFDDKPSFKESFAQDIHDAWVDSNHWDNGYVNDLYMTIIHSGISIKVTVINFIKYFSFGLLQKRHEEALQKAHADLTDFTNVLIKKLSNYTPQLLGIEKGAGGGYTSSLLKFFCKIVHLDDVNLPITTTDISKQMGEYKIAFGNNALEVQKDGKKLFASVMSMKEYNPLSKIGINKILSLPQQMVITQTINFVGIKDPKKELEYQRYIFMDVSKSKDLATFCALDQVTKESPEDNKNTLFCKSQLTIMAMANSLESLDADVAKIYSTMSGLGIPLVKEDLRMEGCFWSQLPGNFVHIQRQFYLHYSLVGGFAVLGGFPFGTLKGKWGSYVCLFKTIFGTPYFFNFHNRDNGHTVIVGDYMHGKTLLMNFLISESLKFNPKVLYVDINKASKIFITLLGGKYLEFSIDPKVKSLALNPLWLDDRPENRDFISHWFVLLMDLYLKPDISNKYMGAINSAVAKVFELPKEKRRLNYAKEFFVDSSFQKENEEIVKLLAPWCEGGGVMENVFGGSDDLIEAFKSNSICAIDLTELLDVPMFTQLPVFLYILHYFRIYCTGSHPSIFALAQGNQMMHSMYFIKNLESILDDLMLNNAVFITSASFYSEEVNWNEKVAAILNKKMSNKFLMSSHPSSYANIKDVFNISTQDMVYVQSFNADDNRFLLKHSNLSILSSISFSSQYYSDGEILARGYEFEKQFEELKGRYSDDTQALLKPFKEYIRQHG